jgi:hypothetical protein
VKRIDVLYDNENREHHLTLTMHLPIVNDGIKKLRKEQKLFTWLPKKTDTVRLSSPSYLLIS